MTAGASPRSSFCKDCVAERRGGDDDGDIGAKNTTHGSDHPQGHRTHSAPFVVSAEREHGTCGWSHRVFLEGAPPTGSPRKAPPARPPA
eukprot:15440834-Alexandrium_andersonii.AAC.1